MNHHCWRRNDWGGCLKSRHCERSEAI